MQESLTSIRTMRIVGCWVLVFAQVAAGQDPPIELAAARRAFDEARLLSEADGGKTWGFVLYGPMLFVDPAKRFAVANMADPDGKLVAREGVFVGTLPDEVGIANTATTWAGRRWTMVMWPLPERRYDRGRLLMHESFHRIQDDLGLPAASPPNAFLDSKEGRTWLRLEWRALAEALIRDGTVRRDALTDALVFRAFRHQQSPAGAAEEIALDLNEGIAEYTGFRTCGLPRAVLGDRAALRLEERESSSSFGRSFAYASGPAYGLLLDDLRPDWRKELKPGVDLGALVRESMKAALPADLAGEAKRRAERYDGGAVFGQESRRATLREQRLAEYRKRFFDSPVLVMPLGKDVNYTYNPHGIEAYDDTSSVYATVRVTDAFGIIEVTSQGALLIRRNGALAEIRVSAPVDPKAVAPEGAGWALRLAAGWKLQPGPRAGDFMAAKE